MRLIQLGLVTVLVVLGMPQLPAAQSSSPSPSQRDDAILNELRLIRLLLERLTAQQEQLLGQPPTPTTTRVGMGDGISLGAADAPCRWSNSSICSVHIAGGIQQKRFYK